MSRLNLDLAPKRLSGVSMTLLLMLGLGCAYSLYQRTQLLQAIARQESVIQRLAHTSRQVPKVFTEGEDPASRRALGQLAQELSLPWHSLLDDLQLATNRHVALMKIQPDMVAGHVEVHGRASSRADFLGYLQALNGVSQLLDVQPVSEEIDRKVFADKPVVFELRAQWRPPS